MGVQSAEAEINEDDGKVTEKTKGSKKTLPGPTWPLDSHPDRVKEYLVKWNMLSKVEDKPVEPNPATAKDEKTYFKSGRGRTVGQRLTLSSLESKPRRSREEGRRKQRMMIALTMAERI